MDKTAFIEILIKERYKSIRQFAQLVNIPHTTLVSMLKNGIGGTSVDTIIKICKELNISVDSISNNNFDPFYVSKQEQKIIEKLRQLPPQELDKVIGMIEMKIYEFCSKKNEFQREISSELS